MGNIMQAHHIYLLSWFSKNLNGFWLFVIHTYGHWLSENLKMVPVNKTKKVLQIKLDCNISLGCKKRENLAIGAPREIWKKGCCININFYTWTIDFRSNINKFQSQHQPLHQAKLRPVADAVAEDWPDEMRYLYEHEQRRSLALLKTHRD